MMILKVLSGVHAGATRVLGPGSYRLGPCVLDGDSAVANEAGASGAAGDVALQAAVNCIELLDWQGPPLALNLQASIEGQGPQAWLQALSGPGQASEPAMPWASLTPRRLGGVLLCVAADTECWPSDAELLTRMFTRGAPVPAATVFASVAPAHTTAQTLADAAAPAVASGDPCARAPASGSTPSTLAGPAPDSIQPVSWLAAPEGATAPGHAAVPDESPEGSVLEPVTPFQPESPSQPSRAAALASTACDAWPTAPERPARALLALSGLTLLVIALLVPGWWRGLQAAPMRASGAPSDMRSATPSAAGGAWAPQERTGDKTQALPPRFVPTTAAPERPAAVLDHPRPTSGPRAGPQDVPSVLAPDRPAGDGASIPSASAPPAQPDPETWRLQLAAQGLTELQVREQGGIWRVQGLVRDAQEDAQARLWLRTQTPPGWRAEWGVASELAATVDSALRMPGVQTRYLGAGHFVIEGRSDAPERLQALARQVQGDLGPHVRELSLNVQPRHRSSPYLSTILAGRVRYDEAADGTKRFSGETP